MAEFIQNQAIASDVGLGRRLNVAFIGGAYDSAVGLAHRTAIEMDRRFQLVAGAFSRNPEKSQATALKFGIDPARAYCDIDHLLAKEHGKVDALVVLTPQDQHARHVIACLDAGFPVICEKALATSVEEAVLINSRLVARSGFLAVTYNYTGYPMIRELQRMILEGRLGTIQQIHMEMPQEGFAKLTPEGAPIVPQEWRLRDSKIPTLSLDLGVHLHMMARFLTGKSPEEVVSVVNSFGNFMGVFDNVSSLVRYSGGVEGNIWYGKTALGYRNGMRVRVFGTKGAAEWIQEKPEYLYVADNVGNKFIIDRASPNIKVATQCRYQRFKAGHPAGFIEAFANYYFDVAYALDKYLSGEREIDNEYVFGIGESLEGLQLLEAVARSAVGRKWERLI